MLNWLKRLLAGKPEVQAPPPPSPCGNDKEHDYWTRVQNWPCPCCMAIHDAQNRKAKERRQAALIAQAVVREMRRQK